MTEESGAGLHVIPIEGAYNATGKTIAKGLYKVNKKITRNNQTPGGHWPPGV